MPDNKSYTKTIMLRNDSTMMVGSTKAYYSPDEDEIRVYRGKLSAADFGMQGDDAPDDDILLIHERQHQINAGKGCGRTPMSASERYQEAMHDEIVASIAEKLELRRRYQQLKTAGQKATFFEKHAGDRKNGEYLRMLQSGKLNPNSRSSRDFAEEMAFIKDSSTDWWLNHDALEYQENQNAQVMSFLRKYGDRAQSNPEGLADNLQKMYSIGGMDFTKYGRDNRFLPVENQALAAMENLRKEGADTQKLEAFYHSGEGHYKLAETLDVSGLSYEQAEKVLQTAIMNECLATDIAGEMAMGNKPQFDFNYVSRGLKNQTAMYLDMKADVWEKNGTLSETGDAEKFARLMQQAKTVKLDPDKWFAEVQNILTIAKDPGRADELAALKQRMDELRGKSVNLDDVVLNMDEFRLPLEGTTKEEVLTKMRQKAAEEAKAAAEYNKLHPEKEHLSELYGKEITDMESDLLKDELEARQKAERTVEPLTTRPQTLSYKLIDGMKYYFNHPQQYQEAELKSYVNERGERIEMTLIDGKKHGAAVLRDENGNIKDVKVYDNGKEVDLSKHKFDVRETEQTVNGEQAKVTQFMLDGKPFGATVVETAEGTKADFYDNRGIRMEGAAGAKIRRTEENVVSKKAENAADRAQVSKEPTTTAEPGANEPINQLGANEPPAQKNRVAEKENTPPPLSEQVRTSSADEKIIEPQPTDSIAKVAENMRKGHNRIAELRARVATGHEEERTAMYREILGQNSSDAEAIRHLRSMKTISSGSVRPTVITAEMLREKLAAMQKQ